MKKINKYFSILAGIVGVSTIAITNVALTSCSSSSKKISSVGFNAILSHNDKNEPTEIVFDPILNKNSKKIIDQKISSLISVNNIQNELSSGLKDFFLLANAVLPNDYELHPIKPIIVKEVKLIPPSKEKVFGEINIIADVRYIKQLDDGSETDITNEGKNITITPCLLNSSFGAELYKFVTTLVKRPSINENIKSTLNKIYDIYFGNKKIQPSSPELYIPDFTVSNNFNWEEYGIINSLRLINNNINQYANYLGFIINIDDLKLSNDYIKNPIEQSLWIAPCFSLNTLFYPYINSEDSSINVSLNYSDYSFKIDQTLTSKYSWNDFLAEIIKNTKPTSEQGVFVNDTLGGMQTLLKYLNNFGFNPELPSNWWTSGDITIDTNLSNELINLDPKVIIKFALNYKQISFKLEISKHIFKK